MFVVRDDQQRARPLRALGQGLHNRRHQRLAQVDVMAGVIVVRQEVGIDDRKRRLRTGSGVREKFGQARGGVFAQKSPPGEPAQVEGHQAGGVVLGAQAAVVHAVPDGRDGRIPLRRVLLQAERLARVQIKTVRPRRPHDRRKPAIANGVAIGQRVIKRDRFAVVEAHHLALFAAGASVGDDKAVVLAAVPLRVAGVPAVRRILRRAVFGGKHRDGAARGVGVAFAPAQAFDGHAVGIGGVGTKGAQIMVE